MSQKSNFMTCAHLRNIPKKKKYFFQKKNKKQITIGVILDGFELRVSNLICSQCVPKASFRLWINRMMTQK